MFRSLLVLLSGVYKITIEKRRPKGGVGGR